MASPYRVAEEMLGAASAQRGLEGMQRTAAPLGPNMYDGGPASKVQAICFVTYFIYIVEDVLSDVLN